MDRSPLSKLSVKVRCRIYVLVLHYPEDFYLVKRKESNKIVWKGLPPTSVFEESVQPVPRHVRPFALARTCKQIRSESNPIFYGIKEFHLSPVYWANKTDPLKPSSKMGEKVGEAKKDEPKNKDAKKLDSKGQDIRACKRWLKRTGKQNAAAISHLVIYAGSRQIWRYMHSTRTVMSNIKKNTDLEDFRSALGVGALHVRVEFECWTRSDRMFLPEPQPCQFEANPNIQEYTSLTVTLPMDSQEKAEKAVILASEEKMQMLHSHDYHGCELLQLMVDLLQDLWACRHAVLKQPWDLRKPNHQS